MDTSKGGGKCLRLDVKKEGEYDLSIDSSFPDDHLFALAISSVPRFTEFANYLACGIV